MASMKKGVSVIEKGSAGSTCKVIGPGRGGASAIGADGCSASDHELAAVFKAIGHPVRLRILRLLAASDDSLCSCNIEAHFPLRQPTISHHMKTLKDAGLVESWQKGSWVHYTLADPSPIPLRELLREAK